MQDGHLTDPIVKVYSGVSRFWTFDPKKFLSQPVYSRDYPPLKTAAQ
jgi:branched-chain amino acid transport system substrate-binding protein